MVFSVSVILFCAVYSIEGQIQGSGKKSVTIDTDGSLGRDRYVWGYAETLTPIVKPSLTMSQVSRNIGKINTENNQNKIQVKTPSPPSPPKKEGFQSTNFQKPSMSTSQVSMPPIEVNNTEDNQNGTEDKTPPKKEFFFRSVVEILRDIESEVLKIVENNDTDVKITIADLCSGFDTPVPDFTSPGTRISEIKCKEYIWKIKYETAKARVAPHCENLKRINTTTNLYFRGSPSVAGGRSTKLGEFPHMGAIGWKGINGKWQFKCGSSLISPKFVLTAAHCTKASESDTTLVDPEPKIIRLSRELYFLSRVVYEEGNIDIDILNIVSHPDYNSPKKYYDIALMELKRSVEFSDVVQPSCLWGYSDLNKLGSTATLSGWGVLGEGNLDISPELLAAELDIIDSDKCTEYLKAQCNRNWCGLRDHQLCAGKLAGGVDACNGDSGSPLQVKIPLDIATPYNLFYILGVTSFGIGCARPNLPGVYTRVSSFIDWIENIVWSQ